MAVDGRPMGSVIEVTGKPAVVFIGVSGTAEIERIDLIRGGSVVATSSGRGEIDAELTLTLEDLVAGEFVYARVLQVDGGAAWTSPVFFDESQ
jgi:hypothetical protein